MKRTKTSKADAKIQRLTDELGPEVITAVFRAYKATAAALYRVARKKAEAQLTKTGRVVFEDPSGVAR